MLRLLVIHTLFLHGSQFSNAIPFGYDRRSVTDSNVELVSYASDPNGRGTVSLIISCLLTLLLCVWSALHLNVPRQAETTLECLWTNTRWILVGIYAPELVVFTAWRQWSSAKLLSRIAQQRTGHAADADAEKSNRNTTDSSAQDHFPHQKRDQKPRFEWTMTHSFFASTGGFAFEIDDPAPKDDHELNTEFLPSHAPRRLAITARGMALLAKSGLLPDVAEEEILDKSKANNLAKALVCIQAIWMLVQVGGRLAARLPVTLLEVNTVAHVLCALSMYTLWWHKPLLPKEPIILRGDWVKPLCAYMFMSSEVSSEVNEQSVKAQTLVKTLFASLRLCSKPPEFEDICLRLRSHQRDADNSQSDSESMKEEAGRLRLASKSSLENIKAKKAQKAGDTAFFERRPRIISDRKGDCSTLSTVTLNRWALAASAIETYPVIRQEHIFYEHSEGTCLHPKTEELLAQRVQNWPWDDLLRDVGGLTVGMLLWLSNFAYGGVHAAAWDEHFPSAAEKWLWRSSAIYISFCGGLWIVLNYAARAYRPLNEFWEGWMDGKKGIIYNAVLGFLVFSCGFAFCIARAFIVVEAFISIRELPSTAYDTPNWSQLLPHL